MEPSPARCVQFSADPRPPRVFLPNQERAMNGFLIGILNIVNQLLALFIIVSATIAGAQGQFAAYYGAYAPTQPWPALVGGILGFIAGLIVAGLVCGFVAAIVTISRELTVIRDHLAYPPVIGAPPR
jgi:uncharacterized protein YqgC (DUF456 family)